MHNVVVYPIGDVIQIGVLVVLAAIIIGTVMILYINSKYEQVKRFLKKKFGKSDVTTSAK